MSASRAGVAWTWWWTRSARPGRRASPPSAPGQAGRGVVFGGTGGETRSSSTVRHGRPWGRSHLLGTTMGSRAGFRPAAAAVRPRTSRRRHRQRPPAGRGGRRAHAQRPASTSASWCARSPDGTGPRRPALGAARREIGRRAAPARRPDADGRRPRGGRRGRPRAPVASWTRPPRNGRRATDPRPGGRCRDPGPPARHGGRRPTTPSTRWCWPGSCCRRARTGPPARFRGHHLARLALLRSRARRRGCWAAAVAAEPLADLGDAAPGGLRGGRPRLAPAAVALHAWEARRQDVRNALIAAEAALATTLEAGTPGARRCCATSSRSWSVALASADSASAGPGTTGCARPEAGGAGDGRGRRAGAPR